MPGGPWSRHRTPSCLRLPGRLRRRTLAEESVGEFKNRNVKSVKFEKGESGMSDQPSTEVRQKYWAKTSTLMWIVMALWVFFSFVIHIFVNPLNEIVIFGFPLGFYMASQGSLIAFVIIIFWYANRQNRIDEEFGVAED